MPIKLPSDAMRELERDAALIHVAEAIVRGEQTADDAIIEALRELAAKLDARIDTIDRAFDRLQVRRNEKRLRER